MSRLYFDLESDGLYREATKIHCLYTYDLETGEILEYTDGIKTGYYAGSIREGIAKIAEAEEIVGHNSTHFDILLIKKLYGIDIYKPYPAHCDDILISRWINPRLPPVKGVKAGPHSMEAWGVRLGHPKVEHSEWSTLTPEMLNRCRGDVVLGAEIHGHLMGLLAEYNTPLQEILELEHAFAHEVTVTEESGHPFNYEAGLALREEIWKRMWTLKNQILVAFPPNVIVLEKLDKSTNLYGYCKGLKQDGTPRKYAGEYGEENGFEVAGDFCRVEFSGLNLDSATQVKKALLGLGWVPDEWNVSKKTGEVTSPKLTESSYASLPDGLGKQIADYLCLSHRFGLVTGLLKACVTCDDGIVRIPYSINTLGTAAHRVTHKVVVNIPSNNSLYGDRIRELFLPEPGDVMVGCDLEGAHLHETAVWMGDDTFTHALLEGDKLKGEDAHSKNAARMGVERDDAKTVVYTFLNGGRAARIAKQINIPLPKAEAALRGLEQAMPKLPPLIESFVDFWKKNGYVSTPMGARLLPRKSNDCLSYALLGTEATIMKGAIVIAKGWMREKEIPVKLLTMNHDDCVVSLAENYAETWGYFLKEAVCFMSRRVGIVPEMKLEYRVGNSWKDVH